MRFPGARHEKKLDASLYFGNSVGRRVMIEWDASISATNFQDFFLTKLEHPEPNLGGDGGQACKNRFGIDLGMLEII